VGGNPFTASSIYTLIHALERKGGVYFPRGGTGALVQALATLFAELGGELRLNAEVSQIQTHHGRVSGVRVGREPVELFDLVVSNADVVHTYGTLLKDERAVERLRKRLQRMRYSMSLFLVYFGARQRYADLAHHNVMFGPRYRELLRDIFEGGRLSEDFSLYLHAPSYSDPSLAPEGCHAYYVLAPVPHLGKLSIDWKAAGPRYADKIIGHLEKHYMPGLNQSLVTRRIFTPEDFRDTLNSHLGSAFSLEPRLLQSAYFRVHNRDPILRGLYFVGAGTHPGAGIPGVVNSAKATVALIEGDYALRPGRPVDPLLEPSHAN
jgi:phytoene desaturase